MQVNKLIQLVYFYYRYCLNVLHSVCVDGEQENNGGFLVAQSFILSLEASVCENISQGIYPFIIVERSFGSLNLMFKSGF